jgi:hypothetical protein
MTNKILVAQSEKVLDQMKNEIAQEFGVELGADTPSRVNGAVGGEMVKRLIAFAQANINLD